jgi:hypothetical protein
MIGLIAWGAAIVLALGIAGVVAYELMGHVRRFRDALDEARIELKPKYLVLSAFASLSDSSGRHRADTDE